MTCNKICIANLDGECVADACRGEMQMIHPSKCTDKATIKKAYNIICNLFYENFEEVAP